ncbi:MAG: R3H domain-containing nucleic acid-binding protein [Patescibacteria group bacterium]
MAKDKLLKTIEDLTVNFLKELDLSGQVTVESSPEEESYVVMIKTEDPGAIIGFHGRSLSAFQLLLGLMVFKQAGSWQRVVVNVNDYREKQTERLNSIALNAAQRAKFSGRPVALPPMTPFERRLVHMALGEYADVETASQGEGNRRCVVIRYIPEEKQPDQSQE